MGYYGMLAVVFCVLLLSIVVQGRDLFSDAFFAIAYAVMGVVMVIGTKFQRSWKTATAIGMLLLFSVGFLSTQTFIELFSGPPAEATFFKLAIVFSLDACALFFLHYGRRFRKEETRCHRYDPYDVKGEMPEEIK
jgi:hypothetical protein